MVFRSDARFQSTTWKLNQMQKYGVCQAFQEIRKRALGVDKTHFVDYEVAAALMPRVSSISLAITDTETILEYNNAITGNVRSFKIAAGRLSDVTRFWISVFIAFRDHWFWQMGDIAMQELPYATVLDLYIWPLAKSDPNNSKCEVPPEIAAFGDYLKSLGMRTPAKLLLDETEEKHNKSRGSAEGNCGSSSSKNQ